MNYRKLVREGIWVHKTIEESKSIEVVSCDYFNKKVELVGGKTVDMDELLKNYTIPMYEGVDIYNLESIDMLGGLTKEEDLIDEPKTKVFKDDVEETLEKADVLKEQEFIPQQKVFVPQQKVEISSEQQMLMNTINLTKGDVSNSNISNIDIEFGFDINKVIQVSKMFDIDVDSVANTILNSENSDVIIKNILGQIIKELSK